MRLLLVLLLTLLAGTGSVPVREGTVHPARKVVMDRYLPEGDPVASVVVCPGGSYHWLDLDAEGAKVGQWLADNGIAAYVLHYRVAGVPSFITHYRLLLRGRRHPDMICDLQRAIRLVREEQTGPVGVMGFSAGGHLVLSAGEFAGTDFNRDGSPDGGSLRPDFIAAIYPVVTLTDERYVHKRSRKGLLGETSRIPMRDSLSLERHVPADMPPVFLLNCTDDPIVDWHNSVLMDSALTAAGVPHRYVRYQRGGHGFGADPAKMGPETGAWQNEFLEWFQQWKNDYDHD